eukprot:m.76766 g.76766  ORF g.76766 m.76766 type:complete len:191 (-) comp17246_c0_seq3:70-642(-)
MRRRPAWCKTQHIMYLLPDGRELSEDYNASTGVLQTRRWRQKSALGETKAWDFEVGEAPRTAAPDGSFMESSQNPVFVRTDSKDCFEWRVRNMPYPLETYSVTVDSDEPQGRRLVLRTTNKKYFKRFDIAEMMRLGLALDSASLHLTHANNTLIISYDKPKEVRDMEQALRRQRAGIKAAKEGEADCNPS